MKNIIKKGDTVKIPWVAYFAEDNCDNEMLLSYINSGKFSIMKVGSFFADDIVWGYIVDANGDPDAENGDEVYEVSVTDLIKI